MAKVSYSGTYVGLGFEYVAVNTPFFDTARFKHEAMEKLNQEMRREGEIVKRAFERTVATWVSTDRWEVPTFQIETTRNGDYFDVFVTTDSTLYKFINNGTERRFAMMPKGYKSKSQPRVIGSRSGGGTPLFVNKNMPPRPGIQAREYVDEIYERRKDFFFNNMDRIYEKVFNKYWNKAMKGK